MKRKSLFLLTALTVSATLLFGCKASDSVDNSAVKSEATETTSVESEATEEAEVITETVEENTTEETETIENNTIEEETEAVEESTESTEIIDSTDIVKGEPLSEKDLAFSIKGYKSYNEYVEAGNDIAAYILADNANMVVSGEFTDHDNIIDSTVRGIKLGDSIDKVFELYGNTEDHSTDIKDVFSHDDLSDSGAYNYFLKINSTKKYFYAFRFRVDQNNNIIAVVIEPISMKYWTED